MKKFKDTVEVTLKDIIEAKVINKRFTGAHVSITKETGKSARAENEKRRQAQRKKLGLENMQMYEGTWATPDTPKKMGQLKKLLKGKLTAKNAPKLLYNLVGNDDLFDLIGEIRKSEGPNADVRDAVKFWLAAHPEVGFKEDTDYTSPEEINELLSGLATTAAVGYAAGKIGQGFASGVGKSVADKALGAKRFRKDKPKPKTNEKLDKNSDMGDYIDDFQKSDAPQFKGKSKEKRKEMAIAAKLSSEGKHSSKDVDAAIAKMDASSEFGNDYFMKSRGRKGKSKKK